MKRLASLAIWGIWASVTALPAVAVPFLLGTGTNPQGPSGLNQGWVSATVSNFNNSNYFVGDFGSGPIHDFFGFDTSVLAGMTINSVQLILNDGAGSGTNPQSLDLRSVNPTLLSALTNINGTDASLFNALASGSLYGNFSQTTASAAPYSYLLNGQALADLQAAVNGGQFFVIGGSLPNVDAAIDNGSLFGFSGAQANLLVDASPAGVPEISPALATVPLALFFSGLCLLNDRRRVST